MNVAVAGLFLFDQISAHRGQNSSSFLSGRYIGTSLPRCVSIPHSERAKTYHVIRTETYNVLGTKTYNELADHVE